MRDSEPGSYDHSENKMKYQNIHTITLLLTAVTLL